MVEKHHPEGKENRMNGKRGKSVSYLSTKSSPLDNQNVYESFLLTYDILCAKNIYLTYRFNGKRSILRKRRSQGLASSKKSTPTELCLFPEKIPKF